MADPYSRRAQRRHHLSRLKNRCVLLFVHHNQDGNSRWIGGSGPDNRDERIRLARTRVNTLTPCSCPMCGNPRHKLRGCDGRTLQEKRFDYNLKSDL